MLLWTAHVALELWARLFGSAQEPLHISSTAELVEQSGLAELSALDKASSVDAIHALIRRRLPTYYHNRFNLNIVDDLQRGDAYDTYTVTFDPSKQYHVDITADSVTGLSRGLLSFIRENGGDIAWSGDSFDWLPEPVSLGSSKLEGASWAKWRYFLNVCSLSYTTVWYDWDKWEYLLDWASLHGINMVLAIGGQEYIWAEVYKDLGLREDQALGYFSGPAFQAWQRMGNIHGSWGGNVTREWLDKQWDLQKKLVSRMVELGITPILPAFNGFVPGELQDLIDSPDFIQASDWNGFGHSNSENAAVDPTWDSWHILQKAFLAKQQELYGGWTSHYYSFDLYNELEPTSLATDYLKRNTENVISSLRNHDPDAVWVMQGWMFAADKESWNETTISALLEPARTDEMLVLDLTSEATPIWDWTESYYGHNWIYCHLMNYGQEQGFYGDLNHYVNDIIRARKSSPSLTGMGLSMEGMNQNELVYELVLDTAWNTEVMDPVRWLKEFNGRRYSLHSIRSKSAARNIEKAWNLIRDTAYQNRNPELAAVNKATLELVPKPDLLQSRLLTYNTSDLVQALDLLLGAVKDSPELMDREAFEYDLVDLARQVFMNAGDAMYRKMLRAWSGKNSSLSEVTRFGETIVDLLRDVDVILGTNKNFLLSTWIEDARNWSDDENTQDMYEFQARNQITIWGTQDTFPWPLNRYASKSWHGVVDPFYVTNWEMYHKYLITHPPEVYNQTAWEIELSAYEWQWNKQITTGAGGGLNGLNPVEVISDSRRKWADWL